MIGMADLEEKVASIGCEKELDILRKRLVKANSILQIQVCFSCLVSSKLSTTGKEERSRRSRYSRGKRRKKETS